MVGRSGMRAAKKRRIGPPRLLRPERNAVASTVTTKTDLAFQRCVMPGCGATYDVGEVRTSCQSCGSLLDVDYDWDSLSVPNSLEAFEEKWSRRNEPLCFSGVWRFYELLPFAPP